jgi:hypothetical protein
MPFKVDCWFVHGEKFSPDAFPDDSTVVVDNPFYQDKEGRKLILIVMEPEAIIQNRRAIIQQGHRFHKIYTCDDIILKSLPGIAVKYLGNYSRFTPEDIEASLGSIKEFKISTWAGSKHGWPLALGHRLRHEIYFSQKEFPENVVFYRSTLEFNGYVVPDINQNPILNETNKLNILSTFQFSVVIENSQQTNYFSEKLIDCLVTKTIPVYWGCPNISEFFDTTGWVFFKDKDDLVSKLSTIDTGHYSRNQEIVEKNFIEAMKYASFYKNLERQAKGALNSLCIGFKK